MEKQKNPASKSGGILGFIERVGNALPHPFILFLYITAALIVISTLLSIMGVQVTNPTTNELVGVKSLLSREGLVWISSTLVSNFPVSPL